MEREKPVEQIVWAIDPLVRKKTLVFGFGIIAMLVSRACFGGQDEDSEALRILMRNCAGCHQTEGHPGALFLSKAKLSERETIRLIRRVVETSKMPPAHAQFKSTADGERLRQWLRRKEKEVDRGDPRR